LSHHQDIQVVEGVVGRTRHLGRHWPAI
jgi:hypothetical protein